MTFMLMVFAIIGSLGFGQMHRCLTSRKTQITVPDIQQWFVDLFREKFGVDGDFFATLANVFNRYNLELPGDSLFKPNIVDKNGLLILMPSTRDTIVVASLRK
ncbi:hypothetical protein BX661DRAFT_201818 [Kickxella alabastrina]|uniref:uncharacterized protein n=1 Tax=Kickxella alabastrina TaxID=61397 RepID=UPI00221F65C3|nr:uncharacterized protein BX661DRAFT_201818 [Kickxella alabastrina]KAI7818677.1 hypothetical protein BX661DRAFT_201818 [Kickxella alabastrina]